MKKGRAVIPDFSRKAPSKGLPQDQKKQMPTKTAPPGPVGKPQATAVKSGGRRGA